MCGLAGIHLFPITRSEAEWERLRHLFTQTLLYNEERGREAAGLAIIRQDGSKRVFKQPVPASEFVEMGQYHEMLATLDQSTVCLLGHTRMPTKGSRWNGNNNHPLVTRHNVGVHNGTIRNDDFLFQSLRLPRRAQVDSELILRMLDCIHPGLPDDQFLALVQSQTDLADGQLALLDVDLRCPTRMLVLKRGNPLCVHYEPSLKALFFSSRYLFLRKAFGRSVITEALGNDSAYLYDALRLHELGKEPVHSFPLRVTDIIPTGRS